MYQLMIPWMGYFGIGLLFEAVQREGVVGKIDRVLIKMGISSVPPLQSQGDLAEVLIGFRFGEDPISAS